MEKNPVLRLDKLVDLEFTCCWLFAEIFYILKVSHLMVLIVLCSYRVDEPHGLVELQKNEWDPVLHWIENR